MRFIGNKENLLKTIHHTMISKGIVGKSFFDFFSGTSNVGRFFKKQNYQVFSSDLLYFSYCLQQAYLVNNKQPNFKNLLPRIDVIQNGLLDSPLELVISHLNNIELVDGFIYKNYTPDGSKALNQPRMYFTEHNGKKIDAIRIKIEDWKNKKFISENEYFILIACLIETVPFYANISGVYAAFLKKWDPRAVKDLELRPIDIIESDLKHFAYNQNSIKLVNDIDVDILYLDPPYNNRQYLPNYHILETIAKYDNPEIRGVTGMRDYENQKSSFCNKETALNDLKKIVTEAKYKHLILSYNSEGIMAKDDIIDLLKNYGDVDFFDFDYLRFKSNGNGSNINKHIKEQLYILSK